MKRVLFSKVSKFSTLSTLPCIFCSFLVSLLFLTLFSVSQFAYGQKSDGSAGGGIAPAPNGGMGLPPPSGAAGFGPWGGMGVPPIGGVGLAPHGGIYSEFLRNMQRYNEQQQAYLNSLRDAERNKDLTKRVDPKLQGAVHEAMADLNFNLTGKKCSDRLQALAAATRPHIGGKEFILSKDSVIVSEGKTTKIYSQAGLRTVSDKDGCNLKPEKKMRDGLQDVFASTLPKVAPTDANMKEDPAAAYQYRERMKPYLDTLTECKEQLGEDYVNETAAKFHLYGNPSPSGPAATRRVN